MDFVAEILRSEVRFASQPLVVPLVLSSGPIRELTEAQVTVTVTVAGMEATGKGSIYLSDLWAWPDLSLTHPQRDRALRGLCEQIAGDLPRLCGDEPAHPLELGLRLHERVCREANPPALALAMCASPFDAAIHDAAGIALGCSAFDFYSRPVALPSADAHFADHGAAAAIRDALRPPRKRLPAWCVVGKDDALPDALVPWIRRRGYRRLKIKLLGSDNLQDVRRTREVFHAARRLTEREIRLTVDTNEANPDAGSVLDYLRRLRAEDSEAFAALQYLEQPTGRDITKHAYDWRPVTRLKPVMLDEGLTGLELMRTAAEQGWSGFALKTCKGHSLALAAAAWAIRNGMLISLQDLTNPGVSMIHAALFAARLPTINGAELNSPQFTPAANEPWLVRLSGLFDPTGGVHRLPAAIPPGLGSGW